MIFKDLSIGAEFQLNPTSKFVYRKVNNVYFVFIGDNPNQWHPIFPQTTVYPVTQQPPAGVATIGVRSRLDHDV